jgi:murein DD-endopeptidase MepM/ murein hydrolase activator NlpD
MCLLVGLGGLIRLGVYVGSYSWHTVQLHREEKRRSDLSQRLVDMETRTRLTNNKLDKLVAFEMNARRVFGLKEIDAQVRQVGVGGMPDIASILHEKLNNTHVRRAQSLWTDVQKTHRKIALETQCMGEVKQYVDAQYRRFSDRPSIMPAPGRITSGYGWRIHPVFGVRSFHEGIDIANRPWTPVRAAGDGRVTYVGSRGRYGKMVYLHHYQSGLTSGYAHLAKITVGKGELVRRGDVIGYIGATGLTTGPHLHYEVLRSGTHIDPVYFILPEDTLVD